jgi:hypothetical protein
LSSCLDSAEIASAAEAEVEATTAIVRGAAAVEEEVTTVVEEVERRVGEEDEAEDEDVVVVDAPPINPEAITMVVLIRNCPEA